MHAGCAYDEHALRAPAARPRARSGARERRRWYARPVSQTQLLEGTVFAGDFRVLRPLSEGGMGAVYVVEQVSTGAQRDP